jgi:2-hydroxy-6-oxonona-2,4-dienedioate hydrolase
MASLLSLLFDSTSHLEGDAFVRTRAPITGMIARNNYGFEQKLVGGHVFMETGSGPPILFCHGLFGSFRNFAEIGSALSDRYRVIVPCMPMYDAPLAKCSVEQLAIYLETFINELGLNNCVMAGNSMGGGAILHYTVRHPENVSHLILFSSSGLSFIPMRGGALKLRNYNYVKNLLSDIFYGSPELDDDDVREIYNLLQNKPILLRCLSFTRSTKKNFMHEQLKTLDTPALIIWGANDTVTPPDVALQFQECLKYSELHYLPECGHCAPCENPKECLRLIESFLATPGHRRSPSPCCAA